jgi:hypothetical protein
MPDASTFSPSRRNKFSYRHSRKRPLLDIGHVRMFDFHASNQAILRLPVVCVVQDSDLFSCLVRDNKSVFASADEVIVHIFDGAIHVLVQ